jgi:hypothetical protein
VTGDDDITRESIEAEFPGWEVWQGIDRTALYFQDFCSCVSGS